LAIIDLLSGLGKTPSIYAKFQKRHPTITADQAQASIDKKIGLRRRLAGLSWLNPTLEILTEAEPT
jgi:hypothetical protein